MSEHTISAPPFESVAHLEAALSEPTPKLVRMFSRLAGDVVVLGVAGKMGPTLARMARLAAERSGTSRRIIGVARFSDPSVRSSLEEHGVETIQGDLLNPAFVDTLPDAPLVVFAAGMKFGSTGREAMTWAMNAHVPSLACRRYADSRIVAFSTGNVYGVTPVRGAGSVETDAPAPVGEYAMSCLGRERMFEHFSLAQGTRVAIVRLNYATELRYGVLVDLARRVWNGEPIDLGMGFVNVIWQTDANAMALGLLEHATSPAAVFNLAGPEILQVRDVCMRFGEMLGRAAKFAGVERPDALLNNANRLYGLLGRPSVTVDQMMAWTADWVRRGGATLGKPTHFEVRSGRF